MIEKGRGESRVPMFKKEVTEVNKRRGNERERARARVRVNKKEADPILIVFYYYYRFTTSS